MEQLIKYYFWGCTNGKLWGKPDWQRLEGKKVAKILLKMSGLNFDDHSNYDYLMNEMSDKVVFFSRFFKKDV